MEKLYVNLKIASPFTNEGERIKPMEMTAQATNNVDIAMGWTQKLQERSIWYQREFGSNFRDDSLLAETEANECMGSSYEPMGGFIVSKNRNLATVYRYAAYHCTMDDELFGHRLHDTIANDVFTFEEFDDEPVEVNRFFTIGVGDDPTRKSLYLLGEYIYDSRDEITLTPVTLSTDMGFLQRCELPKVIDDIQNEVELSKEYDPTADLVNVHRTKGGSFSANFLMDGEEQDDRIWAGIVPVSIVTKNNE